MAYEIPGFSFPLVAGEALAQFRGVKVAANGKAVYADNGERCIGVVQNSPQVDQAATIVHNGISIVACGGAFDAGSAVATDIDGKFIAAATGDLIVGVALEAGAANGYSTVLLLPGAAAAA